MISQVSALLEAIQMMTSISSQKVEQGMLFTNSDGSSTLKMADGSSVVTMSDSTEITISSSGETSVKAEGFMAQVDIHGTMAI